LPRSRRPVRGRLHLERTPHRRVQALFVPRTNVATRQSHAWAHRHAAGRLRTGLASRLRTTLLGELLAKPLVTIFRACTVSLSSVRDDHDPAFAKAWTTSPARTTLLMAHHPPPARPITHMPSQSVSSSISNCEIVPNSWLLSVTIFVPAVGPGFQRRSSQLGEPRPRR